MTNKEKFQHVLELIKIRDKNVKVVIKEKSILQKFLSLVLFFVDYNNFTTTIGSTIYMPQKSFNKDWRVLAHEGIHILQRKRYGYFFFFLYLFPQILVLPSIVLGIIFNPLFFFGLAFLLPIPSPTRAWLEQEAYKMSLMAYHWSDANSSEKNYYNTYEIKDIIVDSAFKGSSYYFMWPFKTDFVDYDFDLAIHEAVIMNKGLTIEMLHDMITYEYSKEMQSFLIEIFLMLKSKGNK